MAKPIAVTGRLTSIDWINPHGPLPLPLIRKAMLGASGEMF